MAKKHKKQDLLQMPRTLGAPQDGSDLIGDDDDLIGNDYDDLIGDDYDASGQDDDDDGGTDDDDGDDGDDDDDDAGALDYDTGDELVALRNTVAQNQLQIQQLLNKGIGTGDDAGNVDEALRNLPDPVKDAAGFNKGIVKLISSETSRVKREALEDVQRTAVSTQISNVELQFAQKYPRLAKRKALLAAATKQEIDEMRGRGMDPQNIIFKQSDKFIARVANRMSTELGLGDPNSMASRKQARNAGRTKGVSRGSSAPQRQGKKGGKPEKPLGFTEQILKQQKDYGLI